MQWKQGIKGIIIHLRSLLWCLRTGRYAFQDDDAKRITERLLSYDLISFDVFDTLLFRKVKKPTDVFGILQEKNGIPNFAESRIRAEEQARKNTDKVNREIDLRDIYTELSREHSVDIAVMMEDEFDEEQSQCYANPVMLEIVRCLKEKQKRVIAVSDMYLGEERIRKLLDKNGYHGVDRVYVSCDRGAGKGNGQLFKRVNEWEGRPDRKIHIGDNSFADVRGGRLAGWDSLWYCSPSKG